MSLVRYFVLTLFLLSGCAGPETGFGPAGWPWPFAHPQGQGAVASSTAQAGYAQFGFDWELSGDPEIMPLQVFDDGAAMWLQFSSEGAWPAVFDVNAAGWRPLAYRSESPYMVLDGVYEHLELRGGHLRGTVRRAAQFSQTAVTPGPEVSVHGALPPSTTKDVVVQAGAGKAVMAYPPAASVLPERDVPARSEASAADPGHERLTAGVRGGAAAAPGTEVMKLDGAGSAAAADYLGAPVSRYAVSPADHTIRQALERWARTAHWTFSAEHWAVDVDIPLVGEASFQTDFKSAVRELLAATEMGDRPLQPCFYSNRVLRVVPYAQACDRRGGERALS